MWKGKHHMKVRSVNDLRPALIHPDFLLHSLAAGTVTVAAGILVDFYMPAVRTLAYIEAKPAGFTVKNGSCGFALNLRWRMPLRQIGMIGELKDLPDFVITHGAHLPGGQGG